MGAVLAALPLLAPIITEVVKLFSGVPLNDVPISANLQQKTGKSAAELREEAKRFIGLNTHRFNLVFCGATGTGKSTLINALLGLDELDPGAAKVGETETTQTIQSYQSTNGTMPYVTIWDTPGGGTENNPAHSYFEDKKLYAFDFIFVVVGNRFLELDLVIVRNAREFDIPFAVVRARSNQDLDARYKSRRKRDNTLKKGDLREQLKKDTMHEIRSQLEQHGLSNVPTFYISSWVLDGTLSMDEYGIDEGALMRFVHNTIDKRRNFNPKHDDL